MTLIQSLVDKQDAWEVIRDEVAAILAAETASQQALATLAGKDVDEWAFAVYTERALPWESLRDAPGRLVNVWFDTSSTDQTRGGTTSRQSRTTTINVDAYASAQARPDEQGGHVPGDEAAARATQQVAKLARNFLKADVHKYLGLRGVVSGVRIQNIQSFQPQQEVPNAVQVSAARLSVVVDHNELHPEFEPETLDLLQLQVAREVDGQIIFEVQYQST